LCNYTCKNMKLQVQLINPLLYAAATCAFTLYNIWLLINPLRYTVYIPSWMSSREFECLSRRLLCFQKKGKKSVTWLLWSPASRYSSSGAACPRSHGRPDLREVPPLTLRSDASNQTFCSYFVRRASSSWASRRTIAPSHHSTKRADAVALLWRLRRPSRNRVWSILWWQK